jgi:Raf kinase inhibitor-like YbhB/YbcL family protein
MQLTSGSFRDGQQIPARHTCDGENIAPDLAWSDLPGDTQSLALCCVDPDAPGGTFVHWTVWDLDPTLDGLPEDHVPPAARQGVNSFGKLGYGGPCPPSGHGVHHYHFQLWALRRPLDLEGGTSPDKVTAALGDVEVGLSELVGVYQRQ